MTPYVTKNPRQAYINYRDQEQLWPVGACEDQSWSG
jgi:hypothetical protein